MQAKTPMNFEYEKAAFFIQHNRTESGFLLSFPFLFFGDDATSIASSTIPMNLDAKL